jgi:hypothetical protein
MDKERMRLIIRNIEILLDNLKAELISDEPSHPLNSIIPEDIDYDEIF